MIGFVVEGVGLQALVQDAGRPGHRAVGVPTGGPADALAHEQANALVGGSHRRGAVEVLLGGFRLRAVRPLVLAVAGAPAGVWVDGVPTSFGVPFAVTSGQVVDIGPAQDGLRTYLAVRGGVEGERTLGSVASDPVAGLGPAALAVGDVVDVGEPQAGDEPPAWGHCVPATPPPRELVLAATWGPRADWFTPAGRELFAGEQWQVTGEGDRVGVRLHGPALARAWTDELRSEGVVPGSVQVPASGQPLVFGPDAPTTGGYPVIAVLDPDELNRLWQAVPGTTIRFAVTTLALP